MSTSIPPVRPLAGLKQALRQCRAERERCRTYATAPMAQKTSMPNYPSLEPKYNAPKAGFRPSQAIKQNRFEEGLRKIPNIPPPRSTAKLCRDPINKVYEDQLKVLDPTGARTRLFSDDNPERVQPGDILLVRMKSGDPFSGVVLNIRKRNSPIDTSILLRNQLTRVGVEMWCKVYSPNVDGIEIVQRKEKRARRAKLYYMRLPKHDVGSVENIVRQYQRQRMGGPMGSRDTKGRDANANRKRKNKKGRN
ncbi:54S ribosomal protein subunit img1, mitochondrial [Fulvia fulva]|uniref:54S ribosomal protein subunit img1, mitochondrial n=1 Tax=Passalora fulva TaxID=5499 RepID=A0A9Q8LJB7_PASFU|nr:54S ribosomal protein subunit img1, mitochondrial [Fulvia fulva]KAK4623300.1 54S ribosomal protein subunit img1, mitochondrial [Fulvia fulva]UJO18447.1 54S ribosomal protein subunit img1, mitochondrial [Fulvia fulva]WPV16805.1 54S ribosomal protein subunit img1, mitochondrial [Fulvia fulva]WPV31127.1 54S ribosomal protein subunit img1, mitochondrial [Fulvia fulva]